jgi:glutamine amidotransferase-like uncharacterized protein
MSNRIALFQHHPECSIDCCSGMIKSLESKYSIKIFDETSITDSFFQDIDLIAFPGGIGDADSCYKFFTRRVGNRIAEFVNNGGHYLGICMGAYWADQWYFDLIEDVRAVQYIKQPNADIKRSYGTVASVTWNGVAEKMYFYDGCALVGDESTFETVARYANGDPMAIIKDRIGLIGCHPESEQYWFDKPWDYIKNEWHQGHHHNLLLDFVDQLMKR